MAPVATQSVTVRLPESLYRQLERWAEQARRTVEDELVEIVTTAVPMVQDLPPDLNALEDEELWRAAHSRFPADDAERFEALNSKRQREGLTEVEAGETATLARRYERAMVVRAQAAALLVQRGHDVSGLLGAA